MKRHSFIQEEQLRPQIPYRELITKEVVVEYQTGRRSIFGAITSRALLTLYEKNDIVVAILHETPSNRGVTIGQGASVIWPQIKSNYASKKTLISVQGHEGKYEYVTIYAEQLEPKDLTVLVSKETKVSWSPAGALSEIIEKHLEVSKHEEGSVSQS